MLAAERRVMGLCELFRLGDGRWSTLRPLKLALAYFNPIVLKKDTTSLIYNYITSSFFQQLIHW
jgi:hypothetical protein